MLRKISLFIFLLFLSVSSIAQQAELKQLEQQLKEASEDTIKVQLHIDLAEQYQKVNPAKALIHAESALSVANDYGKKSFIALAYYNLGSFYLNNGKNSMALVNYQKALDTYNEIEHTEGMANAMVFIASINFQQGRLDKALYNYDWLIRLAENMGDKSHLARAFTNKAITYYYQGKYDNALEFYMKAREIRVEQRDSLGIANTTMGIGNVYDKLGQLDKALDFYQQAYDKSESMGNELYMSRALNNIGNIHKQKKEYDKALQYYTESLELKETSGVSTPFANQLINIGNVYLLKTEYDEALNYYNRALEFARHDEDKNTEALILLNIGILFAKKEQHSMALGYLNLSIDIAKKIKRFDLLKKAYEELSLSYATTGNYKSALEYYQAFAAIKDSILNEKNTRVLAELEAEYENEQNEQKINMQNKLNYMMKEELNREKLIKYISFAFILLWILLAVLLYNRYYFKKKANEELEKLSIVASGTDSAVLIMNPEGEYEWVNEGFTRMTGYTLEDYKREKGKSLMESSGNPEIKKVIEESFDKKTSVTYEVKNNTKDGQELWLQSTLTPILDNKGKIKKVVVIDVDITELKGKNQEIRQKNEEIDESIRYAKKIQEAIMPETETFDRIFPESFILYRPRDIVSGDFYWFSDHVDKILVAAVDCTGHGVPGAFMSMIGCNMLNQISSNTPLTKPDYILTDLNDSVRKALKQHLEKSESSDGMDLALIRIDLKRNLLDFSGANRPLYLIRNNELTEIKGDKMAIGGHQLQETKVFINHQIKLEKGDRIYLTTDGYADQFGGPKNKKFMRKMLKDLLLSSQQYPMEKQKQILEDAYSSWKGDNEQVDDILVIGIEI